MSGPGAGSDDPGAAGMVPGQILPAEPATLVLNAGAATLTLEVENLADRPIQVGSHFHLAEANEGLRFDRAAARGHRLDIPAGTAVRFEPGVPRTVSLVPLAGRRVVAGLRGLVAGPLDDGGDDAGEGTDG